MSIKDTSYQQWLTDLKNRIRSSQLKAVIAVNAELLQLYWDLGQGILEKEKATEWGDKIIPQLAKDLLSAFPEMKGFSRRNLFYVQQWVKFYQGSSFVQQAVAQMKTPDTPNQVMQQPVAQFENTQGELSKKTKSTYAAGPLNKEEKNDKGSIGQQPVDQLTPDLTIGQQPVDELKTRKRNKSTGQLAVAQMGTQDTSAIPPMLATIPWGHHLQIITKCKHLDEALFYIQQTSTNNWSRAVLVLQIESGLYKRKGKALTNFEATLPKPQSDLANALLKNPYQFDFLSLGEEASERDLENALADHLTKFLLELGAGFAYLGRQYKVAVEEKEFFIDLFFYHTHLHCCIVIELKMNEFKPEYAGKLNSYLNAVDAQIKQANDEPTIGLLLCKKAGKLIVEYSLKGIDNPIGISEYNLVEALPKKLKGRLPSIEDIENELTDHI